MWFSHSYVYLPGTNKDACLAKFLSETKLYTTPTIRQTDQTILPNLVPSDIPTTCFVPKISCKYCMLKACLMKY